MKSIYLKTIIVLLSFSLLVSCDDPQYVDPMIADVPQDDEDGEDMEGEEPGEFDNCPAIFLSNINVRNNSRQIDVDDHYPFYIDERVDAILREDTLEATFDYENGVDASGGYYYIKYKDRGDFAVEHDDFYFKFRFDSDMNLTCREVQSGQEGKKYVMNYYYDRGESNMDDGVLDEIIYDSFYYSRLTGRYEFDFRVEMLVQLDEHGNLTHLRRRIGNGVLLNYKFEYDTGLKNPLYKTASCERNFLGFDFIVPATMNPHVTTRVYEYSDVGPLGQASKVLFDAFFSSPNALGYPSWSKPLIVNGERAQANTFVHYEYECVE